MMTEDPDYQEALKERLLARPELGFRAAEFAVGKPKETVEHVGELKMFIWPDDSDVD